MLREKEKKTSLSWISLFLITFLATYLFVFNEWLFSVTKPSFLNSLDLLQQLDILFATSALLAFICYFGLLPLVLVSLFPPFKARPDTLIKLGGLLPAGVFATLILMMIDNFTYTVFKWGVVSTVGFPRAMYGLIFILLVMACYQRMLHSLTHLSRRKWVWGMPRKWIPILIVGFLFLPAAVSIFLSRPQNSSALISDISQAKQFPDILLITTDGLSASHMSVFSYGRDTTPKLSEFMPSALVAENAFPNSGKTSGSVISIYTGKYPAETGVLMPPDVLQGDDAYQHLPGILRTLGYRTIEISFPYYLDAATFNLLDGFDDVRTETSASYSKYISVTSKYLPHDKALFIDEILKRVIDRIRHIFFIQTMSNPYLQVTQMSEPLLDIERLEILKHEIRASKQPIFIHLHLMVTHGPKYKVAEQIYSAGQSMKEQALWTDDFYDDSILEFDKNIGDLIGYLTDLNLLDNTILIIGSDHGQQWNPLTRIPLMIRFPHGEYAGEIKNNVQNMDIAPTILDYIGLEKPVWMHGKSLLDGDLEQRIIYGMTAIDPEDLNEAGLVTEEEMKLLSSDDLYLSTIIYCDQWFKLDAHFLQWQAGTVEGSTLSCPTESALTEKQAFGLMIEHLSRNGFDVSRLQPLSP